MNIEMLISLRYSRTVVNENNVRMKFNIFHGGKLIVYHQRISNHYNPPYLIFLLQTFMKKKS